MMELVNDHDFEGVHRHCRDVVRVKSLHGRKDVSPTLGACAGEVLLAEGGVGEDLSVGAKRLLQDFPTVSDEQE